jgi:hypothetical protein
MKNLFRAAAAISALALSTSAFAQQTKQQGTTTTSAAPQIGVGVGITSGEAPANPDNAGPSTGYLLYVPVNIQNFRIEPFLGWGRSDTDAFGKNSDFTIGVGAFFVQPVASQLQLYAGGRLGSRWTSHKDAGFGAPGTVKTERRDTILALAAGGEYLPIPRVALGAEFQIGYASIGDTKTTNAAGLSGEGGGGSANGTQATLFARIYLF